MERMQHPERDLVSGGETEQLQEQQLIISKFRLASQFRRIANQQGVQHIAEIALVTKEELWEVSYRLNLFELPLLCAGHETFPQRPEASCINALEPFPYKPYFFLTPSFFATLS